MDAGKPSMAIAYAMKKRAKKMAMGGEAEEKMDYDPTEMPRDKENEAADMEDDDMIERIMKCRMMSKGGQVANAEERDVEFAPDEFDDLALRDDLESSYTGANSGDDDGNMAHDEDERDIIARIMRSRAKGDRMPRPA